MSHPPRFPAAMEQMHYEYTNEFQDGYNELVWGVKSILGHRRVETTLRYARTRDSTAVKEYQRAFAHENSLLA